MWPADDDLHDATAFARCPQDHDQAAQPPTVPTVTGSAHDDDDLPDLGRIGGSRKPWVRGGR
jgi:hypothetical protein